MKYIPYGRQSIDAEDIREVVKVLKSDWIAQGPKIQEFENALANYCGAKYGVVVSSGTAALHLACLASGLKQGNEAITTPLTFLSTANAVVYTGARPVFADIDSQTINIDPKEIKKKITQRTKVILPVHFAGLPCDMGRIYAIAKSNKLMVIEDACHALGAKYRDDGKWVKIGSCRYSDMTVFSFHPVKHITTGEGGAILTNNKEFYRKLLSLRAHGVVRKNFIQRSHGAWYYEMKYLGYNYRITDIQAALGISQLHRVDRFIAKRRKIAKAYKEAFAGNPYFDIPQESENLYSSYHLYFIILKDKYKNRKKIIFAKLRKCDIGIQVHYIPVYLHPYYQKLGFKIGLCPNAEDYYNRTISIPIYPDLKENQIRYVIKSIFKVFN